jgi:outer membrane protein insertion porin family
VFFGVGVEQTTIEPGANLPKVYEDYRNTFGESSNTLPLTIGWTRDSRDSALVPTRGRLMRANGEVSLSGDARYAKTNLQFQQYLPLTHQYTLAFNAELGYGKGLNGKPYPVFKNFFGGGLGSVRGFEGGTLGPTSPVLNASNSAVINIGGNRSIALNTEFITPFPGAGNDRSLRMFGFLDIGNIYGENEKASFSTMRASVGIGVSWLSPIGPLRIAFANPIREFPGDRIQKFQFQIGTSF